jgi:hypothetical protein
MQPQRTEKSYGTPGKQVNLDHRLLEAVYSESSTLQNELPSLPDNQTIMLRTYSSRHR